MKIIQDCKFNEISRRSQLYVHLLCPGPRRIPTVYSSAIPRAVPDCPSPYRSRGDECCRGRRLFVGKYRAERSSILQSGASGKFHANRYIELTGLDQTAEGFGPGKWNLPRYGALAWKVQLWSSNCPRYRHQPWKVQPLNPELSVICVFIADGWLCLHRTVRDMEHYRGRFASGIWTVRDIESQRGRFNPWISNCS